jgi:hypothetical protein
MLHTHLYLHVSLIRRTNGLTTWTFKNNLFSEIGEHWIGKYFRLTVNIVTAKATQTPRNFSPFQVAQQAYFFVAFGYDVISPTNNVLMNQLKKALQGFKAVFFTSVVVPTAVVSTRLCF